MTAAGRGARALPLAVLAAAVLQASPLSAQLRRRAAVPTPSDTGGGLLVGLGAGMAEDALFPLSGLAGDLARLGSVTVAYRFTPGAVLLVEGDVLQVLEIERRDGSPVPLDPDVDDGRTRDVGEVRLGTLVRLLGGSRGLSGGLHLAVKLPTSDESRGIGLNTTDFFGSLYGSWAGARWRASGELGVGILEAPLESFVQDDVLSYRAEALYDVPGTPLRPSVSVVGIANVRRTVPLGNEDRGEAWARLELLAGDWRLDAGLGLGYAEISPGWSVEVGVAKLLEP